MFLTLLLFSILGSILSHVPNHVLSPVFFLVVFLALFPVLFLVLFLIVFLVVFLVMSLVLFFSIPGSVCRRVASFILCLPVQFLCFTQTGSNVRADLIVGHMDLQVSTTLM